MASTTKPIFLFPYTRDRSQNWYLHQLTNLARRGYRASGVKFRES
jgi:hypothetical protein